MKLLFWVTIAVVLASTAVVLAARELALVRNGRRVSGRIVAWVDDDDARFPVVEYSREDGGVSRFQSETGWAGRRRPAGTPVPVIYDPDDPERAEIDRFGVHWTAPIALAMLGVAIAVAALLD